MPKDKSEIKTNGKAAFYAVLYADFRQVAIACGYALAVHGSMMNDMDLIAVAWTEEAVDYKVLVEKINEKIGETVWSKHNLSTRSEKPHGRIAYTLMIYGEYYIDLSIIPPKK